MMPIVRLAMSSISLMHQNPNHPIHQYRAKLMSTPPVIVPDFVPAKPTVFRPLRDNVLLIPAIAPEKLGVLFVPENAKEAPLRGRVVSVGPTVKDIKADDLVLFEKYAGTDLVIDDVKHLLLGEGNVVGLVEE